MAVDHMRLAFPLLSLTLICSFFDRHRQSYYDAVKREKEADDIADRVLRMVRQIRRILPGVGTEKLYFLMKDWLVETGIKMGRDKLHELLREHDLLIKKKDGIRTTNSNHHFFKYSDKRKELEVMRPERLWVSDITYLPVKGSYSYLSLITDAYSRKVVGWALEDSLDTTGPLKALKMALGQRKKKDGRMELMHHSDRGTQYCSNRYTELLRANNIDISMVQSGDPRDNGIAERIHRTLKSEFLYGKPKGFRSLREATRVMKKNIEAYNEVRPHASVDFLTPAQAHSMEGEIKKRWKKPDWKNRKKRKKEIILEDYYEFNGITGL